MPDAQTRLRLCLQWLATACRLLRARLSLATQVRQARAAGLTEDEALQSAEPARGEVLALADALTHVVAEAQALGVQLPIEALAEQHDLDALDREILTLAIAPHVDVDLRDAIARFNDNLLANTVDVRLCLEFLVHDPVERLAVRARFAPDGPLRRARLIAMDRTQGAENLLGQEIVPAPRAMQLLLGEQGLLDTSMAGMAAFTWPTVDLASVVLAADKIAPLLSLLQQHVLPVAKAAKGTTFALPHALVVEISGPPGTGKTMLVHALAKHLAKPLLEVDATRLAEQNDQDLARNLYSALDQARLADAVLVLDGVDALCGKGSTRLGLLQDAFAGHAGIVVLTSRETANLDGLVDRFVVQRLILETPAASERAQIFRLHKPEGVAIAPDCDVAALAGQYAFPGALIRNAMQVAVNRAMAADPQHPVITHEILRRACHEQIRASLDEYAVRRKYDLTLSDLVVPPETREDIEELFTAAKHRGTVLHHWGFGQKMSTGKGLIALFSGEPGTGKTLCATILAHELDQQLFQISIPRVVSKWIGETEKNIEKIFESARASHGILLFDEADSLFASRTKVDSSVDRYSNMATNILLQEIENFEGIVLLTTNLEKNIDKAFQRRIGFKVHFPFPEAEYRAHIWQTLIPGACPLDDDVDWEDLGERFELSGGHIKNAVLRAAYQAVAEGTPLATRHLEFAARQECKNAGKVFRAARDRDY
jgi:SpoVK/Ycf46/Vps4 family AAA+-type ATPase